MAGELLTPRPRVIVRQQPVRGWGRTVLVAAGLLTSGLAATGLWGHWRTQSQAGAAASERLGSGRGLIRAFQDPNAHAADAKFPPLKVTRGQDEVAAPPKAKFSKWMAEAGASMRQDDPIAEVQQEDGTVGTLTASRDGILVLRQEKLQWGMKIDDKMEDRVVAVLGRIKPLEVETGEQSVEVDPEMTFVEYTVQVGDSVKKGEAVARVRNKLDQEITLRAPKAGIIIAQLKGLVRGMKLDDVLVDYNLATMGRLPPLYAEQGQKTVRAPVPNVTFLDWKVAVGDLVRMGDPICEVKNGSSYDSIKAPKGGIIISRQEPLRNGYKLNEVLLGNSLAVVGKFPAMHAGFRQKAVEAPEAAIFVKWLVGEGDGVSQDQPLAEVLVPVRRLAAAETIFMHGRKVNITSPTWGSVRRQPLESGLAIDDSQEGATVAVVDMGLPWWLGFLCICVCLWCCLAGLWAVMRKHGPINNTVVWDESACEEDEMLPFHSVRKVHRDVNDPREIEVVNPRVPTPDEGLRLDFDDGNRIHTKFAKYKPLGIKHKFHAPIVVNEFSINSYAKASTAEFGLDVKPGWKLTRIGDQDLNDNDNFEEVKGLLDRSIVRFPLWPLKITFRVSSAGDTQTPEFLQKPLGLMFDNEVPITICRVYRGGPADNARVEEGWSIIRIGDRDVTQMESFREVLLCLREGLKPLNDTGKRYSPDAE